MKQSELIKEFCQDIKNDREKYGYTDKQIVDRILSAAGTITFKDFVEEYNR